jgi:hypothetical protein
VGVIKNYVDIPVPIAFPGCKNIFEPLEWAKKYCPSYISNNAVQIRGEYHYRFYFAKQQDQLAFALRWA